MKNNVSNIPTGMVIRSGKVVSTSIRIKANPGRIWEILMEFEKYPEWNPFVRTIEGDVATGKRIKVFICPPGEKGMVFKPQILKVDACREFRWLGSLFVPYIFDGEHGFSLTDNGDGTTTFYQFERFRGILVPFLSAMLDGSTLLGFEAMNLALKQRAEQ